MMKLIVVSAMAMALAAPALAQAPQSPPAHPAKGDMFTTADADKSGSLSIAEVKMHEPTVTQADFDKADTDKSKSLSKAEFETWAAKKGEKASAPGQ